MVAKAAQEGRISDVRSTDRKELPFRVVDNGGTVALHYLGRVFMPLGGVKEIPYVLVMGRSDAVARGEVMNDLAFAIWETIKQYRALESTIAGLERERDEAVMRALSAETSYVQLEKQTKARVAELTRTQGAKVGAGAKVPATKGDE